MGFIRPNGSGGNSGVSYQSKTTVAMSEKLLTGGTTPGTFGVPAEKETFAAAADVTAVRASVENLDGAAEKTANKVSISAAATNAQYPDAKSVWDLVQSVDGAAEKTANKVNISAAATNAQYPTAKSVWDLVQSVIAVIPAGGLHVPVTIDRESALPSSGQSIGDYYFIQNMDITADGHTGRAWWNDGQFYKVYDQYQSMDGVSIVQTTGGEWQVSTSWLNGLLADAVSAHNIDSSAHADIRGLITAETTRATTAEASKQATLTTVQQSAADSGITAAKVTGYDGLQSKIDAKQATLTTAQQNAADSGITATKVAGYDGLQSKIDAKQDKISATGATNILTAPTAAGGQPGTKAVSDFVQTTGEQTVAGQKTFSASPLVPNHSLPFAASQQAASMADLLAYLGQGSGNQIAGWDNTNKKWAPQTAPTSGVSGLLISSNLAVASWNTWGEQFSTSTIGGITSFDVSPADTSIAPFTGRGIGTLMEFKHLFVNNNHRTQICILQYTTSTYQNMKVWIRQTGNNNGWGAWKVWLA